MVPQSHEPSSLLALSRKASVVSLEDRKENAWEPRIMWLDDTATGSAAAAPLESSSLLLLRQTQKSARSIQDFASLGGGHTCPYCQREAYDFVWPMERAYRDECTPMATWQTTFHPTCNLLHELDLGDPGTMVTLDTTNINSNNSNTKNSSGVDTTTTMTSTRTDVVELLSLEGSWRSVWRRTTMYSNETVVLKLLKLTREFDHESYEHHRIDAAVMERLGSSPYIISAYSYCGQSVTTEWAAGSARALTKNKHLNSRERLKIGRDIARGVAALHSIDYPNSTNATFSHNDINIANAVEVNGRIKLNDFNIGNLLRWNGTRPCGVPVRFAAPLWKSPEEIRNTSYVDAAMTDIYGLGNLMFQVLTTRQPWTHLEPDGVLTTDEVIRRKAAGRFPFVPDQLVRSTKISLQALYHGTMACFRSQPEDRPSSHDLAVGLDIVLQWARGHHNATSDQIAALFRSKDL
jgi:serine/threonine protein kinase